MTDNPESQDKPRYTSVPNEIMTAVMQHNVAGYEARLFWCVARKTLGWHKSTDRISIDQFQNDTLIRRFHISRALDNLIKRKIVYKVGTGYKLAYGINMVTSEWLDLSPKEETNQPPQLALPLEEGPNPKEVINSSPIQETNLSPGEETNSPQKLSPIQDNLSPIQDLSSPKEETNLSPKEETTKERKNINKRKLQKKVLVPQTFDEYKEELKVRFNNLNFDEEFERFNLWWEKNPPKKPKLALFNWLVKAERINQEKEKRSAEEKKELGSHEQGRFTAPGGANEAGAGQGSAEGQRVPEHGSDTQQPGQRWNWKRRISTSGETEAADQS